MKHEATPAKGRCPAFPYASVAEPGRKENWTVFEGFVGFSPARAWYTAWRDAAAHKLTNGVLKQVGYGEKCRGRHLATSGHSHTGHL